MSRSFRSFVVLVITSVALAVGSSASARSPAGHALGSPIAHATGKCGVGSGRGYGYSYLTFLWVYKTGCSAGKSVAKDHGHARGWRCSKKIQDRSPVQYDAKVTCKSGPRVVQWTYTQNT